VSASSGLQPIAKRYLRVMAFNTASNTSRTCLKGRQRGVPASHPTQAPRQDIGTKAKASELHGAQMAHWSIRRFPAHLESFLAWAYTAGSVPPTNQNPATGAAGYIPERLRRRSQS
jgi:hypothetical protein